MEQLLQEIQSSITTEQVQVALQISQELAAYGGPRQFVMIAFDQE